MAPLLSLLLATAIGAQDPSIPNATRSPVTVSLVSVSFDPADLTIEWDQVVSLNVTYYNIQITWRFLDGTSIVEQESRDWFLEPLGFGMCCEQPVIPSYGGTPIGPSLPFSIPDRPVFHFMRKPKTKPPPRVVLVDVDVTVFAVTMSDGTAFGDVGTVSEVMNNWRALDREYAYWLSVIADAWQDDSAIATLRMLVPLAQRPRSDKLGEKVRLQMKTAIDRAQFVEKTPNLAPWVLKGIVGSIEQQRAWLRNQLRK